KKLMICYHLILVRNYKVKYLEQLRLVKGMENLTHRSIIRFSFQSVEKGQDFDGMRNFGINGLK
ncbi:Hypothetical predicted protein, partial [Mytilus galloprovincialis]